MLAAGSGGLVDGVRLADLRGRVLSAVDEALNEVASETRLRVDPGADLLVVDRRSWVSGNVRTLAQVFGDLPIGGPEAKVVAWEGGAVLGLLARAVVAQYDPFRDLLLVVYPNLGEIAAGDGLRWLVFHEITHLAQFRAAPWIADYIRDAGAKAMTLSDPAWLRQAAGRLTTKLPEIVDWLRRSMAGRSDGEMPLLDLLPPEQRDLVFRLNALLTVLEGHATYVTDLIARRAIADYPVLQRRLKERRRRPPILRLVEALAGIDMKRHQYVRGRAFCETVWNRGGADALAPFFQGPDNVPTVEELKDPERWLRRTAA